MEHVRLAAGLLRRAPDEHAFLSLPALLLRAEAERMRGVTAGAEVDEPTWRQGPP